MSWIVNTVCKQFSSSNPYTKNYYQYILTHDFKYSSSMKLRNFFGIEVYFREYRCNICNITMYCGKNTGANLVNSSDTVICVVDKAAYSHRAI